MSIDPVVEDALIQVAMQEAAAAKASGESPLKAMREATEDAPFEAFREIDVTDRERMPVYSTLDGTRSDPLKVNLAAVLKKKFQAKAWIPQKMWGKPAFTMTPPAPQDKLQLLCYLHADHPRRGELNTLGLLGHICQKANIASDYELERHMEKKHKAEWRTVQRAEEKARQEQTERIALLQLEAFKALANNKEK